MVKEVIHRNVHATVANTRIYEQLGIGNGILLQPFPYHSPPPAYSDHHVSPFPNSLATDFSWCVSLDCVADRATSRS